MLYGARERRQASTFALRHYQTISSSADRQALVLTLFQNYRAYVEHEDELINGRVSRTLLLHGFLFTAYGLVAQATIDVVSKPLGADTTACLAEKLQECISAPLQILLTTAENLLLIVTMIGFVTSIGAVIGVHAAAGALKALWRQWQDVKEKHGAIVAELHLPDIAGGGRSRHGLNGRLAEYFVPYTVSAMWLLVILNTIAPQKVSPLITFLRGLFTAA